MALKEDARFQSPNFIDPLTGVYNRYFLYQAVPEIIQKAEIAHINLGILMLDIDNFKNINDTYGHLKGDEALKETALGIQRCIRGEDVVIRYAGDEFIVLLKAQDSSSFGPAGKRIVEEVGKIALKAEEAEYSVTVSAGLAIYPGDGRSLEELIEAADKALYFSKERGKNRLSLAEEVAQEIITQKETSSLFPCAKLINRQPQTGKLKEVLQYSLTGKTSFVLVKGKTGIGKTRLLDEFQKFVDAQQVFSLKVNASQKYTLQPYHAICQSLDDFLKKNDILLSALVSSLSQDEIRTLAALIPLFKEFIKDIPPNAPQEEGISLFKALRSMCVDLSCAKGLLLYFDDIQWLDKATFELLNYLISYEFVRTIMICGALDEKELKEDSACRQFLSLPKDKGNFVGLEVAPFSLQESTELITSIFPQVNFPLEFFQYLYEVTEGSPLFIEEMLKYLVESGIISYKETQWQLLRFDKEDIPSSLEEVLERRFRKLDPEIKEVLAKAVVMGEDFEPEVLRRAIKKDQGYLFDLLDRAKKKSFINNKGKTDKFNFIHPSLQKLIYEQMDSPQKVNLHQEVARTMEELYKDKPQEILGDLVYHYEKAGDTSKIAEYKGKMSKESEGLFNPEEVSSYLDAVGKELGETGIPFSVRIQTIDKEISKGSQEKVIELIKYIFAAIKSVILYPAGNKIREASVEKVYEILKDVFKDLPSLTFSEVERILLVNNKRLPLQKEREMATENFISSMVERDIKGIQFLSSIDKEEINLFLEIFAQSPENLRGGLIAYQIEEKEIKDIKIDVASYQRIAAQERFQPLTEKINKIMLMSFLSGKGKLQGEALESLLRALKQNPENLARNLGEAARSFVPKGQVGVNSEEEAKVISEGIQKIAEELSLRQDPDSQENLHKLILSLDDNIKPHLFSQQESPFYKNIVKSLSDEEIMEIIMDARRLPEKEGVIHMRDLFNKLVASSAEKKEKVTPILKERLKKIGLSETEVSFVTQKKYETLTLGEKIETVLALPSSAYSTLGEENIRSLIKDLLDKLDKDNLQVLLRHLLSIFQSEDNKSKELMLKLIGFFLSLAPQRSSEFDSLVTEAISGLSSEFSNADLAIYPSFLKDLELAIDWSYKGVFTPLAQERWIMRNRFTQLDTILVLLFQVIDIKEKEDSPQIKEKKILITEVVSRLSRSQLVDALTLELRDPFLDYNQLIEKQILKFGGDCIRKILNKILEGKDFSWEGHLYRKKIAAILQKMGKETIGEIKNSLTLEKNPQKLRQLIELAGFIGEEEFIGTLKPFAERMEYEIKEAVALALNNIGGPSARQILIKMTQDKDARVARLARREIKV